MRVRSLGYHTDLFFPAFDSEVVDRGGYTVIRTPSNPTFYWGNFLLFPEAPQEGDLDRWQTLFREEIGVPPGTKHMSFGWDDPSGQSGLVQPFLDGGFVLEESMVLATRSVRKPSKFCEEAIVRPIESDADWQLVIDNHVHDRGPAHEEASHRVFATRQMDRYRKLTSAGYGTWFGAFIDNRLAGDLGIFAFDGIGRFQQVGTHPDFRRRGVCGAMMYHASQYGFETLKAEALVIVAELDHHSSTIYQSVGFDPIERQVGLCRSAT